MKVVHKNETAEWDRIKIAMRLGQANQLNAVAKAWKKVQDSQSHEFEGV